MKLGSQLQQLRAVKGKSRIINSILLPELLVDTNERYQHSEGELFKFTLKCDTTGSCHYVNMIKMNQNRFNVLIKSQRIIFSLIV